MWQDFEIFFIFDLQQSCPRGIIELEFDDHRWNAGNIDFLIGEFAVVGGNHVASYRLAEATVRSVLRNIHRGILHEM